MSDRTLFGVPRLPRPLVHRPRLSQLVGNDSHPTFLWAPQGGGKTVAMAEWARLAPHPPGTAILWLDVDRLPLDRTRFWRAVVELFRDAGLVTPGHLFEQADRALAEGADPRRVISRGVAQLGRPVVLVIDNVTVCDPRVEEDALEIAITTANFHLVSTLPLGGSARSRELRLRAGAVLIGARDLAFTADETRQLLALRGAAAPQSYAEAVHRTTGGHPALTRMAAEGLLALPVPLEPDQLDDAVVRRLIAVDGLDDDPELFGFLSRVSVAPFPTLELAKRLTGRSDCPELFARAERRGLGVRSPEHEGHFELVPLVSATLRDAHRERQPEEFRRLLRTVVDWSLANHRIVDALRGALELDDPELATTITLAHFGRLALVPAGEVGGLLDQLPPAALRSHPTLAWLPILVHCFDADRRPQAEAQILAAADAAAAEAGRAGPRRRLLLLGVVTLARRIEGRATEVRRIAQEMEAVLDRLDDQDWAALGGMQIQLFHQIALAHFATGDAGPALEILGRVATLDAATDHPRLIRTLSLLAGIRAATGDVEGTEAVCQRLRAATWPAGWLDGPPGAPYRLAEAWLALERFDPQAARVHLDRLSPPAAATWTRPGLAELTARLAALDGHASGANGCEPGLRLSVRETEILGHLARGRKLTQIARDHVVSLNTVKSQIRSLYRKLGVNSRHEAVRLATTLRLLPPDLDLTASQPGRLR